MVWIPKRLTRAQQEERRLEAARRFTLAEQTSQEIARDLGVPESTLSGWRQRWLAGGEAALASRSNPGRPNKGLDRERLERDLSLGATHWGWQTLRWTTLRVAEVVQRTQKLRYHPDHLRKVLRQMGWSVQKPQVQAREHKAGKVETWFKETWPEVEKKSSS